MMNKIQKADLDIKRVETTEQLNNYLDLGLARLYQQVFAEPPWCEKFTEKEARKYFRDYFDAGGIIFVALKPAPEEWWPYPSSSASEAVPRPVAFIVSIPISGVWDNVRKKAERYALANGITLDEMAYFAEDGVDPEYRRIGLSAELKRLMLEANAVEGKKTVILRTSDRSYPQISAVNKAGGTVISGLFQDVASKRVDGNVSKDRRPYYVFNDNAPPPDMLEKVRVLRSGRKDIAIVSDNVPEEERKALTERIKKIYPAVRQVVFSDEVAFEGKMYVAKTIKYA